MEFTNEEVKTWFETYEMERQATISTEVSYQRIVEADVKISELTSEIELAIDNIRANVGIKEGADMTEAKIKRLFLNESREHRHLHRICKSLSSTIKSREFDLSR